MPLPSEVWDPLQFQVSACKDRFSPVKLVISGWEAYCTELNSYLSFERAKEDLPLLIHGTFKPGKRDQAHLERVTAICIDHDAAGGRRPSEFLEELRAQDIAHIYQERVVDGTVKYHLHLPLSKPLLPISGQWGGVFNRLRAIRQHFTQRLGVSALDKSMDRPTQGLFPYCIRDGVTPYHEHLLGKNALDFNALLTEIGFKDSWGGGWGGARSKSEELTPKQLAIVKTLQDLVIKEAPGKNGWFIRCPAGHDDDSLSKTLLHKTGRVTCMAEKCRDQDTDYFLGLLDKKKQEALMELRLDFYRREAEENSKRPRIGLHEVTATISRILANINPHENSLSVIKVTPGAGKTWGTMRYLEQYCAPVDGEAGRTAVIAFPTNALMREVSAGLSSPHLVKGGVLSVIGEDGGAACKKFEMAKEVQTAGGNVHRVMCARCEFKDDCPARQGSERQVGGDSTLTLTNHSLLPSVLKDLQGRGRTPLVVVDESPPWIETIEISDREIDDAAMRFLADLNGLTGRGDFVDNRVYPDKVTSVLLEATLFAKTWRNLAVEGAEVDLERALDLWGKVPARRAALRAYGGSPAPDVALSMSEWETAIQHAEGSDDVGTILPFEGRSVAEREVCLKIWDFVKRLRMALRVGGPSLGPGRGPIGARIARNRESVAVTVAGEVAEIASGGGVGVLLDAGANVGLLEGMFGDRLQVHDVDVADAGGISRTFVLADGLSRKGLGLVDGGADLSGEGIAAVVDVVAGLVGKTVVFTYKHLQQAFLARVLEVNPQFDGEIHYYGNVRGYNSWSDRGFVNFVTVGDPLLPPKHVSLIRSYIGHLRGIRNREEGMIKDFALAEIAQAHGRARDPQAKAGLRAHWHFGKFLPVGWAGSIKLISLAHVL